MQEIISRKAHFGTTGKYPLADDVKLATARWALEDPPPIMRLCATIHPHTHTAVRRVLLKIHSQ